MEKLIKDKSKLLFGVTFIFVLVIIFGNFSIIDVHILGIVPTWYRIIIPVFFVVFFIINKRTFLEDTIGQRNDRASKYFFLLLIFWIFYGLCSVFISPWSDFIVGAKEIMSLALGLLTVYITTYLCRNDQFEYIVIGLKVAVIILMGIGCIELWSGWHLSCSRFLDPELIRFIMEQNGGKVHIQRATAVFYNENDYCACLSIFSPIFLYSRIKKAVIRYIVNFAELSVLFLIMIMDDAWISMVSTIIGLLVYLIITKAALIQWIVAGGSLIFVRLCSSTIGVSIWLFFHHMLSEDLLAISKPEMALINQLNSMQQGGGSLLLRINTYLESMKEMFFQSKGLGLGAGSFSNYFENMAEEKMMMSNPHSFWIEVLSQYGVVVFGLFIAILLWIFIGLDKYGKYNPQCYLVMSIGVCFIFASFAPSSFLQGSYYWLPIGMALGLLRKSEESQQPVEGESRS